MEVNQGCFIIDRRQLKLDQGKNISGILQVNVEPNKMVWIKLSLWLLQTVR